MAGDIGINGKSDWWSVVEWFVVDVRDWHEGFFGGHFLMSAVAKTIGRF